MLRKAAVPKRICDRRRAQNAMKLMNVKIVHWHRHTTCEFTEERFLHTVRSIQIEL